MRDLQKIRQVPPYTSVHVVGICEVTKQQAHVISPGNCHHTSPRPRVATRYIRVIIHGLSASATHVGSMEAQSLFLAESQHQAQ